MFYKQNSVCLTSLDTFLTFLLLLFKVQLLSDKPEKEKEQKRKAQWWMTDHMILSSILELFHELSPCLLFG